MRPRRATGILAALGVVAALALLVPGVAEACTVCARHNESNINIYVVIAAFIFVPYAVGTVALRVIRNIEKTEKDSVLPIATLPSPGETSR